MPLPFFVRKLLARTGLARFTAEGKRLSPEQRKHLKYFSDRTLAAPLAEMQDPATFPDAVGPDAMNLNLGAPRFESPVGGWRFSADRQGNPLPWGLPELRSRVAEKLGNDPEVFITHGATAAYAAALDAFVNPGDKVVLFDPSSPLFWLGAKSRRAKIRAVPTWNEEGRTRFLFDALAKAMQGSMLLVLSNPMNPTGGMFRAEDWDQIAWLANRHDALVFADESFARFQYGEQATIPKELLGRCLRSGGVTAGYGLGSLRVGWLAGPKPLVEAAAVNALLSAPFVPTACQQAAERVVRSEDDLFAPMLAEFNSKKQYTLDRLRSMGFEPTTPAGGFFTWVPLSQLNLDGRAFAERLLREYRVLVGPGAAYGPSGDGAIRVSFAAEDGRLREGLKRLERFVKELRGLPEVTSIRVEVKTDKASDFQEEVLPAFSRV